MWESGLRLAATLPGQRLLRYAPGHMKTLRSALVMMVAVPLVALAHDSSSSGGSQAGKSSEADCHHPPQQAQAAAPQGGWTLTRGEALKGAPAVKLADLLAKPQTHDGKTVLLEGQVRKACERKGCWM